MRRAGLVLGVAVIMTAMMALSLGSAHAKDSSPAQRTYSDTITSGYEYNAIPPHLSGTGVGIGQFRATVTGDLPGELDATIYYTGTPGPAETSEITRGTWILCSEFVAEPSLSTEPRCTDTSAIKLTGTVRGGTARWDEFGYYVPGPLGTWVWIGVAEVEATLGITGGTVDGVSVEKGSGKFEGELNHLPLITGGDPTVTGDVTLKF